MTTEAKKISNPPTGEVATLPLRSHSQGSLSADSRLYDFGTAIKDTIEASLIIVLPDRFDGDEVIRFTVPTLL